MEKLGSWIMLKRKLPTIVSPPKLSIHFSIPWVNEKWVKNIYSRLNHISNYYIDLGFIEYPSPPRGYDKDVSLRKMTEVLKKHAKILKDIWGYTPNPVYDKGIQYKGERIRVHANEYTVLKSETMKELFPEAYNFIPSPEVKEFFGDIKLSKERKIIYEEALIDGCNEYEAMQIVYGKEVYDFPAPVGWYRAKYEYAKVFCHDWEMNE